VNVTIIYGTMRKASTYNCVQLLLNDLRLNVNINVTEFFLQKNSSYSCHKYFSCLRTNSNSCNNFNPIYSILTSLYDSDLIILACPVLSCDISAEMTSFLDYLSYYSIQNKAISSMHNKIGLVISTTTGAGLFHTIRTLKRNLKLCGVDNTFKFAKTLYEINWEDVSIKTKEQIHKKIFKLSNKILDFYSNSHNLEAPSFQKMTSLKIDPIFKSNNVTDFNTEKNKHALISEINVL